MSNRTRRELLKHGALVTGSLAFGGLAGVGGAQQGNRPSLAVSSPACEMIELTNTGGPPLTATVTGVTDLGYSTTVPVDRGATETIAVDSGEYAVTATPGRGRGPGTGEGSPAVVVTGSPVTVVPCTKSLNLSWLCQLLVPEPDGVARQTISIENPNKVDVTCKVTVSSTTYTVEIREGSKKSITRPTSGPETLRASARTLATDRRVPVNGESLYETSFCCINCSPPPQPK